MACAVPERGLNAAGLTRHPGTAPSRGCRRSSRIAEADKGIDEVTRRGDVSRRDQVPGVLLTRLNAADLIRFMWCWRSPWLLWLRPWAEVGRWAGRAPAYT
jgi:hypothetical protein